jgi:hypothetical protein
MRNADDRFVRFMQDPPPIRLGGLAANLARIASFADNPSHRQAVLDLIEESKWFIEWAAPTTEVHVAARLAEMQLSLALLESRMRSGGTDSAAIICDAQSWSEEVLAMSGLLG